MDGRVKPGHDKLGMGLKMTKWVYAFGDGKAEGKADMKNLLGGKGANLAEMSNLGLPVPPGLTITTEVCTYYYVNKESYPPELADQVGAALQLRLYVSPPLLGHLILGDEHVVTLAADDEGDRRQQQRPETSHDHGDA